MINNYKTEYLNAIRTLDDMANSYQCLMKNIRHAIAQSSLDDFVDDFYQQTGYPKHFKSTDCPT